MDQLKILIVEDELIVAEDIKRQLLGIGYEVIGIASSYGEALKIIETKTPDLAIVDIVIKGPKSGIDLGRYLHNELNIPFIYLSSHSDRNTVEQAKNSHPNAYLLKPFRSESLFASIEIAIGNVLLNGERQNEEVKIETLVVKDCLFIKKGHLFYKVKINEILFIKGEGNYLEINLQNGNKHLIRSTINNFIQNLSQYAFFQCHKSYVINLEYIDIVSYTFVKIKEYEIPLSKSKKEELLMTMKTFS
jgi:two-component system, LytTR family, response regulator LytT